MKLLIIIKKRKPKKKQQKKKKKKSNEQNRQRRRKKCLVTGIQCIVETNFYTDTGIVLPLEDLIWVT